MYRKSGVNSLFDLQSRLINFLIITAALLYVPTLCMPTAMVLVPKLSKSANKSHVLAHFYRTFVQLFLESPLWVDSLDY